MKRMIVCMVGLSLLVLAGAAQAQDIGAKLKNCEGGDAQACAEVGALYYDDDEDVKMDIGKAKEYYGRSCDLGLAEACFLVARTLYSGDHWPGDRTEARTWYDRACKKGNLPSCFRIGLMHVEGDGGPKDLDAGLPHLQKGCDGGHGAACLHAGWYAFGLERDTEAVAHSKKGCAAGEAPACFNLGNHLLFVEKTPADAARIFEALCKNGIAVGCISQACAIFATDQVTALSLSAQHLEQATKDCDQIKDGELCLAVADWMKIAQFPGGGDEIRTKARGFLQAACDGGDKGSCRVLKIR